MEVKDVVVQIKETVERLGFGMTYSHEELDFLLGLKRPVEGIMEYQEYAMKKVLLVEELRLKLLREHSIYLTSVRSVGYMVMHPKDQISKGYNRCMKDIKKEIRKANRCITHVQTSFLSEDERKLMDANKNRTAFIRAASKVKL